MAIGFACPKCSKKFRVKSELAGKPVKCPCGAGFKVPRPKKKATASRSPSSGNANDFGFAQFDTDGVGALFDEAALPDSVGKRRCPECKVTVESNAILCIQ